MRIEANTPSLKLTTGIGLRSPHINQIIETRPKLGFLELHTENYFGGGIKLKKLETLRRDYPLSFHGVGLSLGRADGLDLEHIQKIKDLVERFEPRWVSEHLSWSAYNHVHVPDLLALPCTHEALDVMASHIDQYQNILGRQILIENPSNYLAFKSLDYTEPQFLSLLVQKTGCKILLDINNIYVSAHNLGLDPLDYFAGLDAHHAIEEYHLAGHQYVQNPDGDVLIDTHGDRVCPKVWALYNEALARFGDHPTLIEWDTDIPTLDVLIDEARLADDYRQTLDRALTSHA